MWKNIKFLSLFVAICLYAACSNSNSANGDTAQKENAHQHDGHDHAGHNHGHGHDHGHDHAGHQHAPAANQYFGAKINTNNTISYDELLEKMSKVDSLNSKVVGKVTEVCQKKGCWMSIAAKDANKPEMFVKFKDYEFFMPKDIAGRRVVMEGYAFKTTTSVEELQHYAEDAGKSKEEIAAITEPEEELQFLASGVILLEED